MATFESSLPQPAPCEVQKYSIRRLEPTIQNFLKIIQIDIDRLRKHTSNFEKFSKLNVWNGLHKENINATRTVQQIKANIKEIENTRKRIVDEDVMEFDKKTSGIKYDAILAIQEFLCSVQSEESIPESPSGSTPEGDDPLGSFSIHRSSSDHMNISLHQLQIESEYDNSETSESWKNLHQPAPREVQKFSIRRLEPTIQKFLKIIQIDIDRLRKHKSNLEKFSQLNDWNGLHKENINATRTVQQIKANIKEIENTRKRIVDEDVEEFDKKTSGMKYDATLAIQEFLCSVQSEESTPESPSGSTPEGDDPLGSFSMHRSSSDHMNISLHQLQIESEHDSSETSESWENPHQPAPCEVQKYSIRRLEPTVQKFLKIIQIDIDRLRKHKSNLEKFSQLNDWNGLHKENINATRTVQQIKANIKEIENTRKRIVDEDVEEFDKKTSGMKYDATLAIQEFLCSVQSEESTPESPSGSTPEGDDPLGSFSMHRSSSDHMNISLHQLQIESEHDSSETSESWENPHQPAPCEVQKYSIRRLEPTVQKILKIIQIDIDRLRKHKSNLEKFSQLNDWNGLHKENINATRTVQQIKANIKEIENTRKRIVDEDVEEFDKKTSGMKYDATLAIQEFLCSVQSEESTPESPSGSTPEGDDPLGSFSMHRSSSDHMNISLHQLQIESEHDSSETSESWENPHQPAPCEVQKYSIRRLEPTVQKFLKIIQIDIDRLRKHKSNLEKFSQLNDWNGLHKENINATRTVQQIKANIKEIENTRKRIVDEDVEEFDKKTSGMKYDATLAIQEFLCSVQSEESTPESPSGSTPEGDDPLGSFSIHRSSSDHMNISLHQLQIESEHDNSETIESWENLHQNLVESNTMIHEFSSAVQNQQESIDRMEDNIEKAHENVRSGVTNLSKASKYKAAAFPVAGALIGTVIGGPVGFLAGLKIGSVAAIGGGAAGFLGGRFYKKRQDKVVEAEMKI